MKNFSKKSSQAVIPAACKSVRGGLQFQDLPRFQIKFKATLDNYLRPCLKIKQIKGVLRLESCGRALA